MKKTFLLAVGIAALMASYVFCMDIEGMTPALEDVKKNVTETFTSIDKELSAAAGKLSAVDLKTGKARKILSGLCKGQDYLIDCAIVDGAGRMIMVEPAEYSKLEGSDISQQAHIITLRQSKKPVFSNVFRSVEGVEAIDFEYPIFSDNGKFIGSVSMLVKQDALFDDIVMPLVEEKAYKIWVMQKDGLIIYDPDSAQIGRNIFSDEFFQPFEGLISFSRTVAKAKSGGGSYDFYSRGLEDKKIVKKYAVWDTVSLYGTEWRIIVMEADKNPGGLKLKSKK